MQQIPDFFMRITYRNYIGVPEKRYSIITHLTQLPLIAEVIGD